MTNQVDISPEAIAQEWDLLSKGSGIALETVEATDAEIVSESALESAPGSVAESEGGLFSDMEGVTVEQGDTPDPGALAKATVTEDEQIQMAKVIIAGGLTFVVKVGMGLDPKGFVDKIDDLAKAYAVVITKYYKGGIFEFLAKFKEEFAAICATIALIGAIRAAKKLEHREEKEVPGEE